MAWISIGISVLSIAISIRTIYVIRQTNKKMKALLERRSAMNTESDTYKKYYEAG